MASKRAAYRLGLEALESRLTPADFRLDLVALHEFGHALGLEHNSNPASIMYEDYNPNYDPDTLAGDPAVIVDPNDGYASLLEIYNDAAIAANTTGWKDSLDAHPGNGIVDLTVSIMPDGAKIKKKINIINTAFTARFGETWRYTLTAQLFNWSSASQGRISFVETADAGLRFNYDGLSQNDPQSGDIRIGAIPMGQNAKLAQTYAPPPNGKTAPGDVHFNSLMDWVLPPPPAPASGGDGITDPSGGGGTIIDDGGKRADGSSTSGQSQFSSAQSTGGAISYSSSTATRTVSSSVTSKATATTTRSANPVDGLFSGLLRVQF